MTNADTDSPVAVVTGASRGIGRAIAERLSAAGLRVVGAARGTAELQEAAAAIPGMVAVTADVGSEAGVVAVAAAADGCGRLRIWINNAATLESIPFAELDPAVWDRTLAVNLRGAYLGCRAAFLRMTAGAGGTIVNIASLSGIANVEKFSGLCAYNVSKAGLIALTEAVALEGRPHGIVCVALSPGAVDTAMLRRAVPHLRPRIGPADVAEIVAFLVKPEAAPLSGVNIPIFSNA
jgi:NAD(P)-dependent dehydrogenase (short-subunit alcohol dehydrogenase family)